MTVAFDTLKLADRLEAAGMPAAQARGTAAALAETMTGGVATAADVAVVRAEVRESEVRLRGEIREGESRLRIEIADLRSEILKWVIGAIGFQTVIIIGAVATLRGEDSPSPPRGGGEDPAEVCARLVSGVAELCVHLAILLARSQL
jgi:hypothetical protein